MGEKTSGSQRPDPCITGANGLRKNMKNKASLYLEQMGTMEIEVTRHWDMEGTNINEIRLSINLAILKYLERS